VADCATALRKLSNRMWQKTLSRMGNFVLYATQGPAASAHLTSNTRRDEQ
jgi:hypothetical protein